MTEDDRIPALTIYRGCRIHDSQPQERINAVVMPELDRVFGMPDPQKLFEICGDVAWSPEARLLAASRLIGIWELATEGRLPRPVGITLEQIAARTAGIDSVTWRDPWAFCSLLDVVHRAPVALRGADSRGPVMRETPLP